MSDNQTRKLTTDDVLRSMRDHGREPVTAREIGRKSGVSHPTAAKRLRELVDSGLVATKKVGGRSRVYWLTEAGAEAET